MPSMPESTSAVSTARTDALEAAVVLMRLEERLAKTHATLPEPTQAMAESEEPPTLGVNLAAVIEYTLSEYVSRAAADLLIAATTTTEELAGDFRAWRSKR